MGAHLAKDAFSNFVAQPLTNQAQDAVLGATGLDGVANQVGGRRQQGAARGRSSALWAMTAQPGRLAWPAEAARLSVLLQRRRAGRYARAGAWCGATNSCVPNPFVPPSPPPGGLQMGSLTNSGIRKVQQFSSAYNQFFK